MTSEKKPSSTRLAASVPGALTAVLLVGAVAFGATGLRQPQPHTQSAQEPAAAAHAAGESDATPKFDQDTAAARRDEVKHDPDAEMTEVEPTPKPSEKTKPAPKQTDEPKRAAREAKETDKPKPAEAQKAKPKPNPTAKPKPAPAQPGTLALEAWAKETKVKLAWSKFAGNGFTYYKVVRSADAAIGWPAGGGDQVVGAIGDPYAPFMADRPPCGTTWHYRVFAVHKGDGAYTVLATSNVASALATCAPVATPGQVLPLAFELTVMPGQGVKLAWQACGATGFVAYKVVRSMTNPDPRFPLNEGTELIAVIGDPGQVHHLDVAVEAGQAWTYRVVAVANGGGGYVPVCQTAAVSATAQ